MKPFKPMLAASLVSPSDAEEVLMHNLKNIYFPVLATPKLDGIRCITLPDTVVFKQLPESSQQLFARESGHQSLPVCRSLKPVPNEHARGLIAKLPPGLDGEIMTYSERDLLDGREQPRTFHEIQSDIMSHQGIVNFKFHVFDYGIFEEANYSVRAALLPGLELPDYCVKVIPTKCANIEELQAFMSLCIQQEHEGICFRSMLYCPYKYGRSTLREQWLVKWKLFETSEAIIVGFEEEMHNANEAQVGPLGHQERSSHQSNMVGKGRLGSFVVTTGLSPEDGPTFKIGTGFTADMRLDFWQRREELLGKSVTFKHQPHGAKDAPRIPVFVGIRHDIDMS